MTTAPRPRPLAPNTDWSPSTAKATAATPTAMTQALAQRLPDSDPSHHCSSAVRSQAGAVGVVGGSGTRSVVVAAAPWAVASWVPAWPSSWATTGDRAEAVRTSVPKGATTSAP